MHQFFNSDVQMSCPFPYQGLPSPPEQMSCPFPYQGLPSPPGQGGPSSSQPSIPLEKRHYEKQTTSHRLYGLGQAFRNSWRKKDPEHKAPKKSSSSVIVLYDQGFIFISSVGGCLDSLSFSLQYSTIEVHSAKFAARNTFSFQRLFEKKNIIFLRFLQFHFSF